MIAFQSYMMDFMIHLVYLLALGVYIRFIYNVSPMTFVTSAFLLAALITLLNHTFLPDLAMSRMFLREGFQCVTMGDRRFNYTCPFRQTGSCPCGLENSD